jgi:hypothetical protein
MGSQAGQAEADHGGRGEGKPTVPIFPDRMNIEDWPRKSGHLSSAPEMTILRT